MHADSGKANEITPIQTSGIPITVLLVDDDKTMHEMLGVALKKTEYSLSSATNADEGTRMITSADPPAIIITDAMMPGASGFSLITSIKSDPATRDIPVILWTVRGQNGVIDLSGKADILMSKPFSLPNILDSLKKARQLIKPTPEIPP